MTLSEIVSIYVAHSAPFDFGVAVALVGYAILSLRDLPDTAAVVWATVFCGSALALAAHAGAHWSTIGDVGSAVGCFLAGIVAVTAALAGLDLVFQLKNWFTYDVPRYFRRLSKKTATAS